MHQPIRGLASTSVRTPPALQDAPKGLSATEPPRSALARARSEGALKEAQERVGCVSASTRAACVWVPPVIYRTQNFLHTWTSWSLRRPRSLVGAPAMSPAPRFVWNKELARACEARMHTESARGATNRALMWQSALGTLRACPAIYVTRAHTIANLPAQLPRAAAIAFENIMRGQEDIVPGGAHRLPPQGAPTAVESAIETLDAEALAEELRLARARVGRLAAAVEAEEAALIRTSLRDEQAAAAAQAAPSAIRSQSQAEKQLRARLRARVDQAEELLKAEHAKLQSQLQDPCARAFRPLLVSPQLLPFAPHSVPPLPPSAPSPGSRLRMR